ncbi:MAG: carbamate kinase [Gammaproteobacteria bacterium]
MRIVVALGGNALLRRGEAPDPEAQRRNIRVAAAGIAPLASTHELLITHGNGPQVGLLALQNAAAGPASFPLDVLGAETEGMIGYLLEQELASLLPATKPVATLLTRVEVDAADPAFAAPSKFIGPFYDRDTAERLAAAQGWAIRPDGAYWRRVVPSPRPQRIAELRPLRCLLADGAVIICAGGGGIPVQRANGRHEGVEAVIDKDLCAALLAREMRADWLLMLTDVDAVYRDWGSPEATAIRDCHADALDPRDFPAGSMGPKVEAAIGFVRETGGTAAIDALEQVGAILAGEAGTRIHA